MKTIICTEEQKNLLSHTLLAESGAPVITGIRLCSPGNLLHAETTADEGAFALRLSRILQQDAGHYPIYHAMFRFPAFIQEILSFAKECALWSIAPEDLPGDTASEQELADIVKAALTLPLRERTIAAQYEDCLTRAAALAPIEYRVRFEPDPFRFRFLSDLKQKVSEWSEPEISRPAVSQELRYAPGVRQEIEACAQEIIRRNTPCTVVLCSYETQLPVLRQVFTRYGIPFSAVKESLRPAVVDAFLSLAAFALHKDCASFLACLEAGAFARKADARLIRHFSFAMTDSGFAPAADRIDAELFPHDHDEAVFRDQEAEQFLADIDAVYSSLRAAASPQEALTAAFEALRRSGLTDDPAELGAALTIRTKLNQTLPLIETEDDAVFILREIDTAGYSCSEPHPGFCAVTDLSHPAEPADTIYILGCSAKAFPGVPLRKGVFDEAYTAKISAYPSLEKRHGLWISQLSWLENSARDVIWSYAAGDYQGREIQPAFEVTSKNLSVSPWKIDKVRPLGMKEHALLPETAAALYAPEGMIQSSVSRIERWFNCPYSWFLSFGLKVRKEQRGGLDMQSTGSLQHRVFEQAVKQYGKDYTRITEQEIRDLLRPAFDSLRALHPEEAVKASLSEERMTHALIQTIEILAESEQAAPAWIPRGAEQKFTAPISPHVLLQGTIDRLDCSNACLRIIDYKSSPKALKEPKVKAGLQLQLLSYLIIAANKEGKTPSGAYYVSMKSTPAPCSAGKFGKTAKGFALNDDFHDPETLKELSLSKRKLSGWTFSDPLLSTDDYKKYFSAGKSMYSYEEVQECITELYEYFYEHASAGEIGVDPVEDACGFCDYKAVCRYHLPARKAQALVKGDTPLAKGKED